MARAARKKAVPTAQQLSMEVERIVTAPRPPIAAAPPPPMPVEPIARTVYTDDLGDRQARQPFGGWLVKQPKGDNDFIAMLIGGAKSDPRFPKSGDPDAVREHLAKQGADGDVLEAVDDAERMWLRG